MLHDDITMTSALRKKLDALTDMLNGCGKIAVALSGGVDSVFLLVFARKVLGADNILALTATGPHFAEDETGYAIRLCDELGIAHETAAMDGILDVIGDNPPDRCYICKREIFSGLKAMADGRGFVLADGTNLDDLDDYRPGRRALNELGIRSPLKDAGLTKQDIRTALALLAADDDVVRRSLHINTEDGSMLPVWEKPAFACLASRIPYGQSITVDKLSAIYRAESFMKRLGFTQIRVRHHGDVARVEVLPEDRKRFFSEELMDTVNEGIKDCGFRYAALDLGGYRMGSLNTDEDKE